MSILAHRLMKLIEKHSDALAETLEQRIIASDRCNEYCRVSAGELKTLVGGIYSELGQWLVTRTEQEVAERYARIGAKRAAEGVPVSQLLWCIVMVKENLWDYLKNLEALEKATEIFGELELMQMVDRFFDHALYYAVRAHEETVGGAETKH